jgi:hypothetical protein
VIDAVVTQTASKQIELILVDLAPADAKRLEIPEQLAQVCLSRPDIRRWGIARAEGARAASSKSVAFIEDHCFPTPSWAEMLIEAHKNPWGGVGYAFTNADPDTYVTRTSLMARYGSFVHPAKGGRANLISGNNVSYKRDLLLSFGPQLEEVLTIDFNLQEILNKRDIPMFVESRALAAHAHFTTVTREGVTGHYYCRLLAAKRAETQHWSVARKLLYGIGAPLGSPVIRLWRLIAGLRGRGELRSTLILGFPVIVAEYFFDSLGESLGYLFGVGTSEREALNWELDAARGSE